MAVRTLDAPANATACVDSDGSPIRNGDLVPACLGEIVLVADERVILVQAIEPALDRDELGDTRHVKGYPLTTDKGDRVTLVDTPGFDNMSMSDMDILGEILKWMSASHSANAPVNGIIYFHRISDPRMTPAAIASLRVLQRFCGESNLPAIALVTTFWDYGSSSQYLSKYEDLKLTYWKGLLDKGSQVFSYDDGPPTGKGVIQYFCDRKQSVLFDFQKEAVDQGLCVEQTSAGIELQGPFGKEKELLKTQIATLNDALSEKEKAISDLETEKQLFEAQINDLNDNLRGKDQVNTELRKSIETEKKSLENEIIELRSAVRGKEEVVNRLQITLIQEKKLYVDQNAKLKNILDEKDKDITKLQDSFKKEERLWHDKTTELEKSIQEKNDELARLKGQQSVQHSQQAVRQVGSGLGLPFRAYGHANKTVKSIEVYWDGRHLLHSIKGIRITWSDGERSQLYGMRTLRRASYDFAQDERIQSMSIDAVLHVYRIQFTTNRGSFSAGGPGGLRNDVDVGNGVIIGIEGRSSLQIYKLGVAFG
ncbi:hypothetical protein BDV24DRAFT_157281 [Aspergillus arachidicola]|uniref:Jacalin-type lectin domain-containing protein n=1 Tax=Aspergillus arachidicola TaxID=656916 RepID=A0A5N6YQJ8_9EURO|nr:hypothetical protein BDV24DRAFT_157281 [Aspergillus arachidicola]